MTPVSLTPEAEIFCIGLVVYKENTFSSYLGDRQVSSGQGKRLEMPTCSSERKQPAQLSSVSCRRGTCVRPHSPSDSLIRYGAAGSITACPSPQLSTFPLGPPRPPPCTSPKTVWMIPGQPLGSQLRGIIRVKDSRWSQVPYLLCRWGNGPGGAEQWAQWQWPETCQVRPWLSWPQIFLLHKTEKWLRKDRPINMTRHINKRIRTIGSSP